MAKLVVNSEILTLTSGEKTLGLNLNNGLCKTLQLPVISEIKSVFEDTNRCIEREKKLPDAGINLVCSDISVCGKWFILCSSNKQLLLWKIQGWELISNRNLARGPSRVRFTPKGESIVVADKSGDVWIYSRIHPNEEGTVLLGHLSMLLDVLVTPNEQYIITCDRDEKIRVSCFPNAYNIHSYCLGHNAFVTSLNLLPHDKNILVSSSGDGTLRLWNFKSGHEVFKHFISFDISHGIVEVKDNILESLAVKAVETIQLNVVSSLLCTIMYNSSTCITYFMSSEGQQHMCQLAQVLKLDLEPWDISLSSDKILWVVTQLRPRNLNAFVWNDAEQKFSQHTDQKLVKIIDTVNCYQQLFEHISAKEKVVSLFFKRKYDNVREYLDRKNKRISFISDQRVKKTKLLEPTQDAAIV